MWTLVGPFDGDTAGDVTTTKTKLLIPGCEYMLGRKDRPLTINHKKISRDHVVFQVGEFTSEDAETTERKPTLKILNIGASNRKYQRGPDELSIDRGASVELQNGDIVKILHDLPVTVKWEAVVCFSSPQQDDRPSALECAKLGISLVWKPGNGATHHLTPTYSLTAAIATSLLAKAHLVKAEWLTALLTMGGTFEPSTINGHDFVLPLLAKYRPSFSPSLPSALKNYRSWEVNDDRVGMLGDYRFLFVGERGREVKDEVKELVRQGGATYECCSVQGGRKALHDALAKAESKGKQPILIADETAMTAALGEDGWQSFVEEAATFELRFIPADKIAQAVIFIDHKYLDCSPSKAARTSQSQSTPDVILNTCPDEPSAQSSSANPTSVPPMETKPPSVRMRSARRFAPNTASREPSAPLGPLSQTQMSGSNTDRQLVSDEPMDQDPPRPTKIQLTRRFAPNKTPIIGIDDPSILDEDDTSRPAVSAEPTDKRPPTQTLLRNQRRFGPSGKPPPPRTPSIFESIDAARADERQTQKYRDVFEQTNYETIAQLTMEQYRNLFKDSQMANDEGGSSSQSTASKPRSLPAVQEEEDPRAQRKHAVAKRKAQDALSDAEEAGESRAAKVTKRRAIEGTNAVEPTQPSRTTTQVNTQTSKAPTSKTASKPISSKSQVIKNQGKGSGAAPGKHDTDAAFLKAVASTRRGKKLEDTFDREFNELRIAKPDLEADRQQEEWAILEEFGDDSNLRGNFMVIVEMDVYKKDDTPRDAVRVTGGRADWEGRPNFKKFKQKAIGERPKPVEVVIDEDMYPYEIDNGALKSIHAQMTLQMSNGSPGQRSPVKTQGTTQATDNSMLIDDDDDMALPVVAKNKGKGKGKSTPQSRVPSVDVQPTPAPKPQSRRSHSITAETPLFLDHSDKEDEAGRKGKRLPGATEAAPDDDAMVVDEDSTSETLPTLGQRTQRTQAVKAGQKNAKNSRKRPIMVLDDDSDDGFTGFVNKRARR